jgi:hypothetical protein
MGEYYLLNDAVKPEHLLSAQFTMDAGNDEAAGRLRQFASLVRATDALYAKMPGEYRDAFYELVVYPVRCSALANEKVLCSERNRLLAAQNDPSANTCADEAERAYEGIKSETKYYNTKLARGKWMYMMSDTPHDLQVCRVPEVVRVTNSSRSMPATPGTERASASREALKGGFVERGGCVSMDAAHFSRNVQRNGAGWRVVEGLGRTGNALTVFPTTAGSVTNSGDLAANAPCLEYEFKATSTGPAKVTVYCVPVHRLYPGRGARYALAIDDGAAQFVDIESEEYSKTWGENVLRAAALGTSTNVVESAGAHTLKLWMVDPGLPVDKIVVDFGGAGKSYFGPPETRAGVSAN